MNNHFFFSYAGNKRQEIKIIYDEIEPSLKDVKTIIEPYCGTSAMSYYISTKHPKEYKYILNDNNKMLIMLYKLVQEGTKEKEVEDKINKYIIKFNECKTNEERKIYYNSILKDNGCICSYIFINKYYRYSNRSLDSLRSLRNAFSLICRTRSFVSLKSLPISSKVLV